MNKRVLLIADLETWILGKIARSLSSRLSKNGYSVTILYSHSKKFLSEFKKEQRNHTLIHFLSPWDFFELYSSTFIPAVVTLWHIVDWKFLIRFRKKIDVLVIASDQWREKVAHIFGDSVTSLKFTCELDSEEFTFNKDAKPRFLLPQGLDSETVVFGFAGSAWSNESERKGLDRLWKCLENLENASDLKFVLRIVGRHWDYSIVPDSLKSRVVFSLDLDDSILPDFYSSLDYYICTSRIEGVPYPVIEAMSCERVVLSTPVGIVPEILINECNGFLLDQEKPENDFCEILNKTLSDLEVRQKIGMVARKSVIKKLSSKESSVDEFSKAYDFAISKFYGRKIIERFSFRIVSEISLFFKIILTKTRLMPRYKLIKSKLSSLLMGLGA
jgi:glycosyltransferase involved in cell wall biosynthesis